MANMQGPGPQLISEQFDLREFQSLLIYSAFKPRSESCFLGQWSVQNWVWERSENKENETYYLHAFRVCCFLDIWIFYTWC